MSYLQVKLSSQPAVVRIMSGLNQVGKPKSKHNSTLHCTLQVTLRTVPMICPTISITFISQSRPPVSLSHATTASTLSPSSSRFTLTFEHNHHKKSNCAVRAYVRVLYAVRLLPIKRRKLCVYVTKSQAKRCFWVGLIGPTWPDGCEAFCVHLWMFV